MIATEIIVRIRQLFFGEHWKVGTIASELGVHHEAVENAIEKDRFLSPAQRAYASRLDPYKAFIVDALEQYPKLRATRLFHMIRGRGYTGSVSPVRRFVRKVRPKPRAEAYLRLRTLPGEQGQVDWAHFGKIKIGHAERPLSCFVMVLSWSRAMFAVFTLDQTLESFLRAHLLAFAAFQGLPRRILYDNLKSVVVERQGDLVRYNSRILELAGHYHFEPIPCAPYRGNEKGKVERTIQYLRHSFFAARRFSSVADLNRQLHQWIAEVAHARPVPGDPEKQLVSAALDAERPLLLPLPEHPIATDHVVTISSGKTPYVRFDRNDYSIPHDRIRQPLTLAASETEVRILDGATLIARHARSYDRGQIVEDSAHIDELARKKHHARDLRGRDRLRNSCENAAPFLSTICTRGEPLASQTTRLVRLLERYGARALDDALAHAIERGAFSATSVAHILEQKERALSLPPPVPCVLSEDPRVRDLHLEPHALSPYDGLASTGEEVVDDNDNNSF